MAHGETLHRLSSCAPTTCRALGSLMSDRFRRSAVTVAMYPQGLRPRSTPARSSPERSWPMALDEVARAGRRSARPLGCSPTRSWCCSRSHRPAPRARAPPTRPVDAHGVAQRRVRHLDRRHGCGTARAFHRGRPQTWSEPLVRWRPSCRQPTRPSGTARSPCSTHGRSLEPPALVEARTTDDLRTRRGCPGRARHARRRTRGRRRAR